MEFSILGRTGLEVSVAGLGCGGPSRLGLRANRTETDAISLVRRAVDMGVNLIDTADVYGTEEVVGKALEAVPRDRVVISTKRLPPLGQPDPVAELKRGLEQSLRRLKTDYVDIYHLHSAEASSIPDAAYRFCRYEPGVHAVLTGTGNADHLRQNLDSLLKPPLSPAVAPRLKEIFAKVDCVSGD